MQNNFHISLPLQVTVPSSWQLLLPMTPRMTYLGRQKMGRVLS